MSLLNPFGLLGLDYSASREEVRLAFKELALICHPDKGGDMEQMRVLYLCYKYKTYILVINSEKNNYTL